MNAYMEGKSGLLNAPTGSGKTFALWLPVLVDYINTQNDFKVNPPKGLQVLWITPLRALAKDLHRNMQQACDEMQIPWQVGIRTGDIKISERNKQNKAMPQALIITPESLHILFAQKNNKTLFKNIHTIVVDEWHELAGSKRGVQTELALAHLRHINPALKIWGISATIGNLEQAKHGDFLETSDDLVTSYSICVQLPPGGACYLYGCTCTHLLFFGACTIFDKFMIVSSLRS